MESLDLALELNALRYNSHLDSDFDSATQIDEFSERIIERSNPKPAKIKREVSRLAEPYQPANNTATRSEECDLLYPKQVALLLAHSPWSGRSDLNRRSPASKTGALA